MSGRKVKRSSPRSLSALVGGVCLLAALFAGCGEDASRPDADAPNIRTANKAAAKVVVPSLPKLAKGGQTFDDMIGEGENAIDPRRLKNPFKPFIRIKKQEKSAPVMEEKESATFVPKTELQKYTLEELSFVGIMELGGEIKALVQDPSIKGYTVGVGTYVGDRGGQIKSIDPREGIITIEVRTVDVLGEPVVKQSKILINKTGDEVKR